MATFNYTVSTNNVNTVLYTWSTRQSYNTDRPSGSVARGGVVLSVDNLGVGVASGDPFTLMS